MDSEIKQQNESKCMFTLQPDSAYSCRTLQGQEADQIALAHHQIVPEAGRQIVPEALPQTVPGVVPQTGPGVVLQTGLHEA